MFLVLHIDSVSGTAKDPQIHLEQARRPDPSQLQESKGRNCPFKPEANPIMAAAKSKKEERAEKLGTKRACPECEAKFYDLNNNPAVCPMCQNSFDPIELDQQGSVLASQLKSSKPDPEDEDEDEDEDDEHENTNTTEVNEEDIDEEEEAKELELDGDDAAIIGGSCDSDDEENPNFGNLDDDEDEDAALVADYDNEDDLPPGEGDDDDDDDVDDDIDLDT